MLVCCADNVTLHWAWVLGNFGLQPTLPLLTPAPAVSNHQHLSGYHTSRTGRQRDSVQIHLIECSPLIGPQIQRRAPIGPDTIYTRCRELSSLKLGHSLETCGRDAGSGDNVPISCWSASCARLSQPRDCQNQAETNCSSESTVSWRDSRSPQLRR